MRNIQTTLVLALAAALAAGASVADETQAPRQQGAHVHGVARLELVSDAADVHLRFDSPVANLVGFEHAPRSPEEQESWDRALATLKDGERLFRFTPAAECTLVGVEVDAPVVDLHGGGDPAHPHNHAETGRERHQDEAHADLAAAYRFTCRHPQRLNAVAVGLLAAFPAIERLRVEYVTSAGQGAQDLTPGGDKVELMR